MIFVEGQPVVRVSAFVNTKSILPPAASVVSSFPRAVQIFRPASKTSMISFRTTPHHATLTVIFCLSEISCKFRIFSRELSTHPSRADFRISERWRRERTRNRARLSYTAKDINYAFSHLQMSGGKGIFFAIKIVITEDDNLFNDYKKTILFWQRKKFILYYFNRYIYIGSID